MKKVICQLTSAHPAIDKRIYHKTCRCLKRAGYEVAIVAPHSKDEVRGGVKVYAVPRAKNRLERMTTTVWRVYRKAVEVDADAYQLHDPELLGVGVLLRLRGKKVLYDAHEDLPRQVLGKEWIPRWVRRTVSGLVELFENVVVKVLNGVVPATPTIAKRFPKRKTVLFQNFPPLEDVSAAVPLQGEDAPRMVAYVGIISRSRGSREMLDAMMKLSSEMGIRLLLAGYFHPADEEQALRAELGWQLVEFAGFRPREELREILAQCRVGLVLLHGLPNYIDSQPVKMFEYMAAGLPVVASDFPLWRSMVEDAGCGLVVDPLDADAIAGAIRQLLENPKQAKEMGQRGQEAVRDKYNLDTEGRRLGKFYDGLLGHTVQTPNRPVASLGSTGPNSSEHQRHK